MADVYAPPLLTYPPISGTGLVAAAKTAINNDLSVLIAALTPTVPFGVSMPHTGFSEIPPGTAKLIVNELTAIQGLITAGT